ncbi:leucine-rich repeat-containing protein 69 isoform X2 [Gambusia affinis]|uniref:leucine-rich repeat-containing protein 69 isoform X2 n=1 Tax=Gambusia affinis TaxID=33528 RepID=UPI001CDD622C|nr:leucine-rich repeat-containing protein 69 isoform X2 [Gambusia affinis]
MAYSVVVRGTVYRAMCGNGNSLNLNSSGLKSVPEFVSRFPNLSVLLLCYNSISDLPTHFQSLCHLTELNLGNNALKEFPVVLSHLGSLRKLYLYRNKIDVVSPDAIGHLRNLVVLNLNHNNIQRLPPEIGRLRNLQHFTMLDNKLEELPDEVGCLKKLCTINLTFNNLSRLPQQLYSCKNLIQLYVARNRLTKLPEGITALVKLRVLDVAGNMLSIFPIEFHLLHLTELYCEENWLIKFIPVPLPPQPALLSLKVKLFLTAERPVVQQQLLYRVQGPLPHFMGGVCAIYQSEEGHEHEELSHYSSPVCPVFIQMLQRTRTLLLCR